MKTAVAVLFLAGFYAFASGQEDAPTNHAVPPCGPQKFHPAVFNAM